MQDSSSVHFDSQTYALILGTLAQCGCFHLGGPRIDGAEEAGFSVDRGPTLFDEIVADMAKDKMEIKEEAATYIANSFLNGFSSNTPETSTVEETSVPMDTVVPTLDGINTDTNSLSKNGLLIGRVTIDESSAICPATGSKLRLFKLDEDQRRHVHDTLLEMAQIQHQEFRSKATKKMKNNQDEEDSDRGFNELLRFSEWLE